MRNIPGKILNSRDLRVLIWIYLLLLMFEGALRKWILPGLSDPLLLIRDPVLLLIYLLAISRGVFPFNGFVIVLVGLGIASLVTGITMGSNDAIVTSYGFDAMYLHLPLIFILPKVLTQRDVLQMGRFLLYLTFPMAVLMVLQFKSSPDHWINCGAGGGVGSQMQGAMGKVRPPGLFTFITGAAQFLALSAVFLIYGFWKKGSFHKMLLFSSGMAVAICAVVSTSRLALGGIGTVFMMVGVVVFYDRKSVGNVIGILIPIGLIMVVATNLDIFKEGRQVFEVRLAQAGDSGSGVLGAASNWSTRVFGDFYGGILAAKNAPPLGAGLGVGTNVGARMLSGRYGFLLAEGEWARVVLEIGPLLGFTYLGIRLLICYTLFANAASAAREGNALPMLLFGSCALLVTSGQFSQTSSLGFAVVGAGMCLAARNVVLESGSFDGSGKKNAQSRSTNVTKAVGISPYAKLLRRNTEDPKG